MAPESFDGHPTFSSDIWSLGMLLFEMLTGRWPFGEPHTSTSEMEMVELIRKGNHATACDVCPGVPVALSKIIDRALQKHPADRFVNAQEMLNALSDVDPQAVGRSTDTFLPELGGARPLTTPTATSRTDPI